MEKITPEQREALVSSLHAVRMAMKAWMTLGFRCALAIGLAALGVALVLLIRDENTKAGIVASLAGLGFCGFLKLGMDMTRCDLQFNRIEIAITAGKTSDAIRSIAKTTCFSALEKFADDLKNYEQSHDPDGDDPGSGGS